ncbi:MAG: PKD domain-containing protein [Acidimicrobiales bacterium]
MKRKAVCGLGLVLGLAVVVAVSPSAFAGTGTAPAGPATFSVGAASVTINPTYPVYLGGYGGGPDGGTVQRHVNPLTGKQENFTVRAISIASGGRVVELARVDSQGWFAGYQEGPYGISDVRAAAAAFLRSHGVAGARSADIVVSSLHEHASPTIMGIWGPPQHNLAYLKTVAAATEQALEQAFLTARPATLAWSSGNAPWLASTNIARGNTQEGWPMDGSMFALWARDARTGATIATYVEEPGYPNIVNGDHDLIPTQAGEPPATLLSTDFPSYVQSYIQKRLGGLALVASGTLGGQPGPVQDDYALSPDLPPVTLAGHTYAQTRGFDDAVHMGELIGNLTMGILGHAHLFNTTTLAAAQRYVLTPVTGAALMAGIDVAPLDGGALWTAAGGNSVLYPIDRSTAPPYQVGPAAIGTWVTGLRIGRVLILTEPGEFFASIHQTWSKAVHGTAGVFVIGMAQDQLGYSYPAYTFPFVLNSADEQIFNPSVALGDQVALAGELVARQLGFPTNVGQSPETTATGNNYQATTQPGVQFLPYPRTGDLSARTGSFAPLLEAVSTPPRFSPATICSPPVLPSLPTCPTAVPHPTMGPYTWSFGDGTTGTSPAGTPQAQPWFSHAYTAPGTYLVTASASDGQGATAKMSLALHVYPALTVSIDRLGSVDSARVGGGSGHVLVEHWVLPDGSSAWGPQVTVPAGPGPVTLTVTDSTGTMATATAP